MKKITVLLIALLMLGLATEAQAAWPKGTSYHTIRRFQTSIHVVKVHLNKRSIRSLPSGPKFPLMSGGGTVPQLGQRYNAPIAINGDFKMKVSGVVSQPKHAWVMNRTIETSGVGHGGASIVLSDKTNTAHIGPTSLYITMRDDTGRYFDVDRVNQGHAGLSVFTPRGGWTQQPVDGRCYARLLQKGGWHWTDDGKAQRTYKVGQKRCGQALAVLNNSVVVESSDALHLTGEVVWTQNLGMRYASQLIGGNFQVVSNGHPGIVRGSRLLGPDGNPDGRNPRTAFGVSRDGKVLYIVAVDGRLHNQAGVTYGQLARVMKRIGSWDAFNLDGGGGTLLWKRGSGTLSNPSEPTPRPAMVGVGVF
jgi:hypothetical protein